MIEFIKPRITSVVSQDGREGTVEISPLAPGYGLTVGNSIRRVLLNSVPGVAVTKIRLEGNDGPILHEFSVMPGVKEDVCEIILNVKEIIANMATETPTDAVIDVVGPCVVTDSAIKSEGISVLNPDHYIATVEDGCRFNMVLTFEQGLGFVANDKNRKTHPDCPIGTIFVDSKYTPIRHVGFHTENVRIEDASDYEKLVFDIKTTGVHTVNEMVAYAAGILAKHFASFTELSPDYFEITKLNGETVDTGKENLSKPIEELQLSIRSYHCLKRANINTVEDVIQKTLEEMKGLRSLGEKSLNEIRDKIHELGFTFKDEE